MSNEIEFLKEKIKELNRWTKTYDEGNPTVSDKFWDEKYEELIEYEKKYHIYLPESPTQCVSYQVVNQLEKIEHEYPMLSLAKTKDWDSFVNYFSNKKAIGMLKLDGLTCALTYELGYLTKAETRGNGSIGENILHTMQVVSNVPKRIPYLDKLVVMGEVICTEKNFREFSNEYANPRNFASGSIRLLDAKECAKRNLSFILWNVAKGLQGNSFSEKLQQAQLLGFDIVPWVDSFDKDFLLEQSKNFGYPIDGLVAKFDDIEYGKSLGATGHHENSAYAFKFYDETYPTELINIEWGLGRTNQITPVAIFNPIEIDGSVVEKASLHNYSVMCETLHNNPWINQKIWVCKKNQIIPQIEEAEDTPPEDATYIKIPKVCPVCGQPIQKEKSDSGTINLVCNNPKCEGKLINIIDHYAGKKSLDIRGLSEATLEKLVDWGWVNSVIDLYSLKKHRNEWIKKEGFGPKSVDNILAAIENSKNTELHLFITSIGIPLIGSTYAKQICKQIPDWKNFREKVSSRFDFSKWDGFGPEMCYSLWTYDYTEADKIAELLILNNSLQNSSADQNLVVCITGKLNLFKNRAELQTKIESIGGKVSSSVSKNTNYLINNDNTSTSAKNLSAKKLGIPILTEKEFFEKFLKNS